ncbi:LOW QUALITY PROTEIN: transmembrane protein 236 [Phacochoerus africanus]|uniref:LOW QUALITY PROTEIN: transmembrane protein 236 n=1 Tax=Phacochoerus africanus TaxID=41426 RepID=UPI001FDA47CA|nr:LOW QUALITY PROTEIN: transmembrane protein 236 [Phacochoerus africanus]
MPGCSSYLRMVSGKLIKLLVFELLEFVAFCVPTLVIMEQFAAAFQNTRQTPERTHYWLIVSCSIAYVALVTLLIWIPVKVLLFKKRHLYHKIKGWRPVMMMCVVLTTLPSFSFSIAVTEVQKNSNGSAMLPDMLPDLPVSLVLTSLIIVDIIEKLRIYPLRGRQRSNEDRHIQTTTLQQVKTVTDQVRQNEENQIPPQPAKRTKLSRPPGGVTQSPAPELEGPQEPTFERGVLSTLSRRDVRAEIFLWSFLLWADTIEMVRVAGHPKVYKSGWVYPVYLFSFLSLLRIVLTPQNPLHGSLGILLQDLPFIFIRLSLIIVLGTITPILGLCKNVLVTVSYVYFNYLTRFRIFSGFETSF